ncbi:hypothetical protein E8E14_000778 [Neopestalotiopsis sp. 37M]|nr:hypothetical protein E8E14_000778 [Neopestalotiopsis sp. 37M]
MGALVQNGLFDALGVFLERNPPNTGVPTFFHVIFTTSSSFLNILILWDGLIRPTRSRLSGADSIGQASDPSKER